jgi:hypothetical protein
MRRGVILLLLVALLLTACKTALPAVEPTVAVEKAVTKGVVVTATATAGSQATRAPAGTPVATPTPQPTDSPTPSPTATPLPTRTPTSTSSPTPTPSPTPTVALPVLELRPPMVIDSEGGRLYLAATADGVEGIVALAATDGQWLATYLITGQLAVDNVHGWLYVDQDETGLSVLDAPTGERRTVIALPSNSNEWREENPVPQADPLTGQVLAFRDNVVYIADPSQGAVVDTISFDIPKADDCRSGDGPLPISWVEYDNGRRILYLDFLTYVCTPWFGDTVVSYDLNARAEIARGGYSYPTATAFDGALYGSSWYRMGVGYRWLWREGQPRFVSADWGNTARLYVDSTRGWLYEASAAGGFRVFDAETMSLLINIPRPVEGDLVGYDPRTDQLYFLSEGQLRTWLASAIQPPTPEPLQVSNPPAEPVGRLFVSPAWSQDRTLFGLWDYDVTQGDCYVFGSMGGLLYLSCDGGNTWGQPRGGLRGGCERISALAVSPGYARDQTLLAGVVGRGVFKSTDGGQLWQPASTGLSSMYLSQILLSPDFEHDQTAFATAGAGGTLYRSTSGGTIWQSLDVDVPLLALSPEFDRDQTLMGVSAGQVLLSRDSGDTWEQLGDQPNGASFAMLSIAPLFERWQVAFAFGGGTHHLYRSADGGRNWESVLDVGGSAFRSSSQQLVYGPETADGRLLFLSITVIDNVAGASVERRTLYRSVDGGRTWQTVELPGGIWPMAVAISPSFDQDGLLFVGTADGQVHILDAAALAAKQ